MAGERSGQHMPLDALVDYYAMSLSEEEEIRVEEHLMECPPCTELAHAVHRFSQVLDSWTARSHGAAAGAEAHAARGLRESVARGIRAAHERVREPALRERLASWARTWDAQAGAAARVLLEGPGIASRIMTGGLDTLAGSGPGWSLIPAAASPIRGTFGRPGSTEVTVALGPARIEVSGQRGDIVVRLERPPRGQESPLVLLVDPQGDAPPRVEVPRQEPGVPYLLAHFEGVVPGEYLVVIESGT